MFVCFSVSCTLIKYVQKVFICLGCCIITSCKDFKSWESTYTNKLKIKFEQEKDPLVPKVLKDLGSKKLLELSFIPTIFNSQDPYIKVNLSDPQLSIPLNPESDQVSFALRDENNIYYHKVTIHYKRIVSLVSPKAGGLQVQYLIKNIQFATKVNKRPIFKRSTIDHPVPLNEKKEKIGLSLQENKIHVTLYY